MSRKPAVHLNLSVPSRAAHAAAPPRGRGRPDARRVPSRSALAGTRSPCSRKTARRRSSRSSAADWRPWRGRSIHALSRIARSTSSRTSTAASTAVTASSPSRPTLCSAARGAFRYTLRPEELRAGATRNPRCPRRRARQRPSAGAVRPDPRRPAGSEASGRGCGELRDRDGSELWAIAEVPSNALLARQFAAEVDGISIGSNDLTQLVLGADRDSAELSRNDTSPRTRRCLPRSA